MLQRIVVGVQSPSPTPGGPLGRHLSGQALLGGIHPTRPSVDLLSIHPGCRAGLIWSLLARAAGAQPAACEGCRGRVGHLQSAHPSV